MKITDLLKKESIALDVKVDSKGAAIDYLVDLMDKSGRLNDKEGYKKGILAREALGSTAVGDGIAIPHAKVAAVNEPGLAAMVVPEGVDYESFDGSPANLLFMIAAPDGEADAHLEALSKLSMVLMDPDFKNALVKAKTADEFLKLINDKEADRFAPAKEDGDKKNSSPEKTAEMDAEENNTAATGSNDAGQAKYRILAVTACPTGIAHTFMAAENLSRTGEKLGYPAKVETNGADGVQNHLTKEEIEAADGIIIAADKNVEMARFNGKPVIIAPVSDGIHKAEELIKKIEAGEAPIYHHAADGGAGETESADKENLGRSIYKHLMNGVSHMLPFVIGGGILIALAFLFDD